MVESCFTHCNVGVNELETIMLLRGFLIKTTPIIMKIYQEYMWPNRINFIKKLHYIPSAFDYFIVNLRKFKNIKI